MNGVTYRSILAVPGFGVLLGGFGLFLAGETMKILALSVLVCTTTGSATLAAFAYAAGFLPYAIGGTLLLSLADRCRPRPLLAGFDLLRAVVAGVLALDVMSPVGATALVFAVGLFGPVPQAARTALTADLLGDDGYVLGRSLFTIVSGATQILGTTLLTSPAVRRLLLAQWLPGSLMVASEGVVVAYVSGLGHPAASGTLLAASAFGMLAGDLVVARFVPAARRERLTPWLALLQGIPLLAFARTPGIIPAAVLVGIAATGFAYQLGLARRFLDAVPEPARGQALGLASTGLMVGQGLAVAGAGALADRIEPGRAIAPAGAACLVSVAALWRTLSPAPTSPTAQDIPRPG